MVLLVQPFLNYILHLRFQNFSCSCNQNFALVTLCLYVLSLQSLTCRGCHLDWTGYVNESPCWTSPLLLTLPAHALILTGSYHFPCAAPVLQSPAAGVKPQPVVAVTKTDSAHYLSKSSSLQAHQI